jgi:Flp pilus assembly protein TadD
MPRQYINATIKFTSKRAAKRAPRMNRSVCAFLVAMALPLCAPAQTGVPPAPAPTPSEEIAALAKSGRLQRALERADAVLVKSPRDVQVRFLRAVILGDMGKTADATAALEAMTQDFPELPEPHNNLGVLLAGQGRYEPARAALQRAIAAAPDYVTAHENLGDLYVAMAAEMYSRAAQLDPKATAAQNKLKQTREFSARLRTIK